MYCRSDVYRKGELAADKLFQTLRLCPTITSEQERVLDNHQCANRLRLEARAAKGDRIATTAKNALDRYSGAYEDSDQ
jgi:hypothetical protein